jgi:hypothetical protein
VSFEQLDPPFTGDDNLAIDPLDPAHRSDFASRICDLAALAGQELTVDETPFQGLGRQSRSRNR